MGAVLFRAWNDLRACIAFYTLLPVGPGAHSSQNFATAQWAAPIAGALIGTVTAGVLLLANWVGLSPMLSAGLALSAAITVTGALHEDGLADMADGFGGGRDITGKLAIMKDSSVGTYGALALMISFTLRLAALTSLASVTSSLITLTALIAAHAASRSLLPAFMFLIPSARETGLAAGAGDMPGGSVTIALALGALGLGALALSVTGPGPALVMIILLAGLFAILRALCLAQIGGHTGDVLGALQQLGEIVILIAAAALLSGQPA